MRMLLNDNIRMAINSLRSARWRSGLTMFGVIVGAMSAVMAISIGGGIKQQIGKQIDQLGKNVITVQPGRNTSLSPVYQLGGLGASGGGSLNNKDLAKVLAVKGVESAVPLASVSAPVKINGKKYTNPLILATTENFPSVLNRKLAYGSFFAPSDGDQNSAIIGPSVARNMFGQEVPLGQQIELLGQQFIVRGVLEQADATPLSFAASTNDSIIIPYGQAMALTNDSLQAYEILAKASSSASLRAVAQNITNALSAAHGGQQNFTVLRQDQTLQATNRILDMITAGVALLAAISLLVGGIGIMNVMLVSVTERMHEIGIRKAVGATNYQIMAQFLVESLIVSILGGVIGAGLALVVAMMVDAFTSLHTVVNWWAVAGAIGISGVIGAVFGTAPAVKAARKDPILALRHE